MKLRRSLCYAGDFITPLRQPCYGLLRRRRRRFWVNFFQTSSAFGDLLDLSDHPLLLDIFSLGPPQLRTGLGFLFFYKVSFEKHPNVRIADVSNFNLDINLDQTTWELLNVRPQEKFKCPAYCGWFCHYPAISHCFLSFSEKKCLEARLPGSNIFWGLLKHCSFFQMADV